MSSSALAFELFDKQVLPDLLTLRNKHSAIRAHLVVFLASLERNVATEHVTDPSVHQELFKTLRAFVERVRSQITDWNDEEALEMDR